jgi:hypothetical protein
MQLYLLAASPSLAQVSSIALCGCILGRVQYQMIMSRTNISMRDFSSIVISCASIQIVFKVLDNTNLNWVMKMMPIMMCH